MKKVLLTILTLVIMLSVFGISASATETNETQDTQVMLLSETQTPDDSGTCGDNVTWEYYASTKTIIIKGQGDMKSTNWTVPYTTIITAIIEPGVTSIAPRTFYSCTALESVTIPSGVTKIGTYAFYSCKKLTQVEIPATVQTIERYAFSTCSKLAQVTFNEGLVTIGERAFYNCLVLKSLDLPNSLVTIDRYTFNRCKALKTVTIPSGVQTIGLKAFYECVALESCYISDTVKTIGESVFTGCTNIATISVDEENPYFCAVDNVLYDKDQTLLITYPMAKTDSEFKVPDTVVEIANFAFHSCGNLNKITFPQATKTIGEWAFAYCTSLTNMEFPSGMDCIGDWAFAYCDGLKKVKISDTVTTIAYGAFGHCKALESVHIPAEVTTIESYAFTDCTGLSKITVDEENANYCAVDNVLYNKDKTELLRYAPAKLDTEFTVPDTVKTVSTESFSYSTNLEVVVINEGVTQILVEAFLNCTALTEVVLPETLESVGDYALYGCNAFKTVCYDGNATSWKTIKIGEGNTKLTGAKRLYAHMVTFTGDINDVQKVYTGRYVVLPVAGYGYEYVYTSNGQPWESIAITKDCQIEVEIIEVEVIRSSVYTISNGFIRKIDPGTTVAAFLNNVTPAERVKVYKDETAENQLGNNARIGTGCVAKLYDVDGNVICTLEVVIMGDASGDGRINAIDLQSLVKMIAGERDFEDAQNEAVNLVGAGIQINAQDLAYLKGAINGTRTIKQA